jgi:hypothetical protein
VRRDARAAYDVSVRALARIGTEPAASGLAAPELLRQAYNIVFGALGPTGAG